MKFIQSFVNLQQASLASCENAVSKQISWLKDYSVKNGSTSSKDLLIPAIESVNNMVRLGINLVAAAYDMSVIYLDASKSMLDETIGPQGALARREDPETSIENANPQKSGANVRDPSAVEQFRKD